MQGNQMLNRNLAALIVLAPLLAGTLLVTGFVGIAGTWFGSDTPRSDSARSLEDALPIQIAGTTPELVNASAKAVAVRDFQIEIADETLARVIQIDIEDLDVGEDCFVKLHVKNGSSASLLATLAQPSCACAAFQAGGDLRPGTEDVWTVRVRRTGLSTATSVGIQIPHHNAGALAEGDLVEGALVIALKVAEKMSRRLFAWTSEDEVAGTGVKICVLAVSDSDEAPASINAEHYTGLVSSIRFTPPRQLRSGDLSGDWVWYSESEPLPQRTQTQQRLVVKGDGWRAVRLSGQVWDNELLERINLKEESNHVE
jgi:hypothetical protein